MQVFHFGSGPEPLFGTYHPAEFQRTPSRGVLLCNPFGEEAIRAHRIFRVLAARLAREGIHVLRFDYFGTGDSSGESPEGTPGRWQKDVRSAHDELVRRSNASQVVWVGLRYGANLALAASARPVKLARLILWDPLLNGREYLTELAESHAAYMRWELERWQPAPDAPPQALGWPLTDELRRSLERLDFSQPGFSSARHTLAILSTPDAGAERIAARMVEGQTTDVRVVQSQSPWNSDEALNSTLVPGEIVNAIIEVVKEPC
jgi:pimeloyl-ACP methyl ester carboxylesterase